MENNDRLGKGNNYCIYSQADKHYFAGFFNLAQNNIEQLSEEFCERIHIKSENGSFVARMFSYFEKLESHSDWERATEMLKEYLPVINKLFLPTTDIRFEKLGPNAREEARRNYFRDSFKLLTETITQLRHYYSHHYHAPLPYKPELYDLLDQLLLDVCLDVRKQKMKDDHTREIMKQRIADELDKLRQDKKKYLEEKKKENKKIKTDAESIENAVFNDAFGHLIVKDQDKWVLREQRRTALDAIAENQTGLSESGLLFLLSIFLSKRESEQLRSNIKGYKGKVQGEELPVSDKHNSLKYMATHWVYSDLAYKGLKKRVKNTFDKESLLMQMIDELSKVPDEVYRNLTTDQQKEFLEDINEYVQERNGNDQTLSKFIVVHPVIRKRYENKFNYFALRFLDEFVQFPTLKFQVFTGYFTHDKREKTIVGVNLLTERSIREPIHVFGHLSELSKCKSDYFAGRENGNGWELFPNPAYSFIGNNIPIYIDLSRNDNTKEILEYRNSLSKNEKRKNRTDKQAIIASIYGEKAVFGQPTALLSANELPALLYELLVNNRNAEDIEQLLLNRIAERYQAIRNFKPGQTVPNSMMSTKLRKSDPSAKKYDTDKLKRAIEHELQTGREKLQTIDENRKLQQQYNQEKQDRKKHSKNSRPFVFYNKEKGNEAVWIANDMKRFMPLYARSNWKGYQHSELQRLLAFYEVQRSGARDLLFHAWDHRSLSPDWSNDIYRLFSHHRDFESFYAGWLKLRQTLLERFLYTVEQNEKEPRMHKKAFKDIFIAFSERVFTIRETNRQKAELLAKPFVFPRGLFDPKPTYIKGILFAEAPEKYADWYRYCYEHTNEMQSFYELPRDYSESFKTYQQNADKHRPNKYTLNTSGLKELSQLKEDVAIKNEKFLDLFVKLMADHAFHTLFGQTLNLPLSDFYQTKAERNEKRRIAEAQHLKSKGDDLPPVYNETFVWNQLVPVSLFGGRVYEPQVPIKDVGKFRKIESDERVQQLIEYNPDRPTPWSKQEIEDELENKTGSYERIRRDTLILHFHELEAYILKIMGFDGKNHPKVLQQGKNPNFKMYLVNGLLQNKLSEEDTVYLKKFNPEKATEDELNQLSEQGKLAACLVAIRNKYLHNQLPPLAYYELMNKREPKTDNESYSEYFLRQATDIIRALTQQINSANNCQSQSAVTSH